MIFRTTHDTRFFFWLLLLSAQTAGKYLHPPNANTPPPPVFVYAETDARGWQNTRYNDRIQYTTVYNTRYDDQHAIN